jgi:transposase-like protein
MLMELKPLRSEWLGERCCIQRDHGLGIVVVCGSALLHFEVGNEDEERLAAVLLAETGEVRVGKILAAFGLDDATLWRARTRYREQGVGGLVAHKRGRKVKATGPVMRRVMELHRSGLTQAAIAMRVVVSEALVRSILRRHGVAPVVKGAGPGLLGSQERTTAAAAGQVPEAGAGAEAEAGVVRQEASTGEASSEPATPVPAGRAGAPAPRAATAAMARLYAVLGLTADGEAEVVLETRRQVAALGLLVALPALAATGLLEKVREVYGGLRKGVYGLRATVLVLSFLALLRRPRPEALKGLDPGQLGAVLGLERVPEMKTLRRKLQEIAKAPKAHRLWQALARLWLAQREDPLGVAYVDGHVRAYHGKHRLPKTRVTQRNLCLPATTDYWVNDVDGLPVFVVTATANAALTKVLPEILKEVEKAAGGRQGTVVFDRGGWSPDLFKRLMDGGWHVLTYRKGKLRKHPRKRFREETAVIDGRPVTYTLSEVRVRLRNGLALREIAELREDGGQTQLVTSRFDHPAVLLAHRMFERWRQENYFRYMKENFDLDALVDYEVEPDDPTREAPNPARTRLQKQLAAARKELGELERAYGAAAADNTEAERPTMRGFKIANGATGKALRAQRVRVARLRQRLAKTPKRIAVGKVASPDEIVRLSPERKLFTHAIKAAVYRAESALVTQLRPHFPRAEDEGRAFLREVMQLPGDLIVEDDDVTVRLAPMSAPRFTAALEALCKEINAAGPGFPETAYRLRFEVALPAA